MSQRRGKKKELIMEPTATQTYKQTKEVHSKPSYIKKKIIIMTFTTIAAPDI